MTSRIASGAALVLLGAGCDPVVNVAGSFFPAWMVSMVVRGGLTVAGAVVAGLYAYRLSFVKPRTDDAAVRANVVGIAPQVSGPIVDLRVVDNQHVNAGDLLFAVDCRPYEARLARTRADLALALKEVDAQRRAIASAGSEVGRREANLASATAQIARAEEERAAAEAAVARLQ